MTQAAVIEAPRLAWAGTGDGVRTCPVCEGPTRVVNATSAQGLARCPWPGCGAELYVRIGYEWREGQARLFRDEVTLAAVDAFRAEYLREYRPGLGDYLLGRWRSAVPVTCGAWAVFAGLAWGAKAARPELPYDLWQLSTPLLLVTWFAVSVWMGRAHVVETAAWHRRKRTWAERVLEGTPVAELEAVP